MENTQLFHPKYLQIPYPHHFLIIFSLIFSIIPFLLYFYHTFQDTYNIHIHDVMIVTVTTQGRWEWYLCSFTNKATETQNLWRLNIWDFNTSFPGPNSGLLLPHHTSDMRESSRDAGLPTPGSWEAVCSSFTAPRARPSSFSGRGGLPSWLRSSPLAQGQMVSLVSC